GRVDAAFWWNSSPVISRVVGSSASFSNPAFNQEWVEVFNPTTWTWDATKLNLHYYMTHNSSEPAANALPNTTADYLQHKIEVNYINTAIPPGGYFLFANAPTIDLQEGSVNADAVWETVNPSSNAWWRVDRPGGAVGRFDPNGLLNAGQPNPDILTTAETANYLPSQSTWNFVLGVPAVQYNGGGGYVRLTYSQNSSTDYIYLDGVGWRGGLDAGCVGGGRDPVAAEEGYRLVDKAGGIEDCAGLQAGEQYLRYASTMAWMESRDVGPAYDSNCNVRDWSKYTAAAPGYFARFLPRNSVAAPVPVVSGRDDWTRASNRLAGGNEAGFVNAFVNDGLTPTLDGLKPTYYSGWTPSSAGYCTTCPRSNMYNYTNSDIPWWGRFEFLRVSTGLWTLGMYARRITGGSGTGGTPGQTPYDYHTSSQITVNVTPGSYTFWQGVVGETTDKVFLFGSARDVYDVPIEDLRVEYKVSNGTPAGAVLDFTRTRVGGAYSLAVSSSVNQVYSGVHINNPASGDYVAALNDVWWRNTPGPPERGHEFWGGEGYYVNSCACPDTHLPYTGYLAGFVRDSLGAGIPDVVVSAINAATKEERASATTYATVTGGRPVGWFRINVSTGDYQVKVMTERGETVSPAISGIVNIATSVATAGGIVVGTFTITNAYGNRSGSVVASSTTIQTGALIVLTTGTIAGSTPTAITSQFRAGGLEYYMTASNAAGRYTFDVKMGTYNVYGFYPYFNTAGDVTWVKRSISAFINSGNNATDFPVLDLTP
nr:carboxypeptidase-like regulatory domain-containing protein [Elusimicrobiota bacterium]